MRNPLIINSKAPQAAAGTSADAAQTADAAPGAAAAAPQAGASGRIHVADTSALGLPEAEIRIACSKGTYIRALARDLGEALGSGAHLSALIRTRSGAFRVENALSVEQALAMLQRD